MEPVQLSWVVELDCGSEVRLPGADGGVWSDAVSEAGVTTQICVDPFEWWPRSSCAETTNTYSWVAQMLVVMVAVVTLPKLWLQRRSLANSRYVMSYPETAQQPGVEAVHDSVTEFVVTAVTCTLVGGLGGNGEVLGMLGGLAVVELAARAAGTSPPWASWTTMNPDAITRTSAATRGGRRDSIGPDTIRH